MQEHLEFLVVGEGFHEAGQSFELLAQTGNGTVTAGNGGGKKLCGGKNTKCSFLYFCLLSK